MAGSINSDARREAEPLLSLAQDKGQSQQVRVPKRWRPCPCVHPCYCAPVEADGRAIVSKQG